MVIGGEVSLGERFGGGVGLDSYSFNKDSNFGSSLTKVLLNRDLIDAPNPDTVLNKRNCVNNDRNVSVNDNVLQDFMISNFGGTDENKENHHGLIRKRRRVAYPSQWETSINKRLRIEKGTPTSKKN